MRTTIMIVLFVNSFKLYVSFFVFTEGQFHCHTLIPYPLLSL